jgi:hypothetical protein
MKAAVKRILAGAVLLVLLSACWRIILWCAAWAVLIAFVLWLCYQIGNAIYFLVLGDD